MDLSPAVSLDQHHWIGLAKALKQTNVDPTYKHILELATTLRRSNRVRLPLSMDRYFETWRISNARQRIDVASAMAALSGYETMLNLDDLTILEIDAAIAAQVAGTTPSPPVDVFGRGAMHAWGRTLGTQGSSANGHGIVTLPAPRLPKKYSDHVKAAFEEIWRDQFEWPVLSGDPRIKDLDPSIREDYSRRREQFAQEEERRSNMATREGLNARKAGFGLALTLHIAQVIGCCEVRGVDPDLLPLDTDPIGFIEQIPTIHVLAELLASQYRNPRTSWKPTDWADMRTLCQAVVYCDAVAPDRHWADVLRRTDLPTRYSTVVVDTKEGLLDLLDNLAYPDSRERTSTTS